MLKIRENVELKEQGRLFDLVQRLKDWFVEKNEALLCAGVYVDWTYEVVKETEKAIQFKLDRPRRSKLKSDWLIWIPKSIIER